VQELDDTDRTVLRLLMEDGRRSWREVADAVDLSPPAVANRVDRLRELGVIRRFTVDVDRSRLRDGVAVLVALDCRPGRLDEVRTALAAAEAAEHLLVTAGGDLLVVARVPDGDVPTWLDRALGDAGDAVRDREVTLLTDVAWTPTLGADLRVACAECGNAVSDEGVEARIDGERYRFCCPSCRTRFEERRDRLAAGVDDAGRGDGADGDDADGRG
jgi:DNA-binding Lrp family transcriptional regulator